MTKDKALQLALEALEINNKEWKYLADSGDSGQWNAEDQDHYQFTEKAIIFIKKALETKNEFVAWEQFYPDTGKPQIAFNAEVVGYVAPKRTWVELTDEDAQKLAAEHHDWESLYFAVQAKLKEKNT